MKLIIEIDDKTYGMIKDATYFEYSALKAIHDGKPLPKGYWIRWYEQKEHDLYTENIPHCKCSECSKEYDAYSSQFINYCANCGADMREGAE